MKALRLSLQALLLGLALLTQPVRAEAPAQLPPDLLAVVWQQTSAEYKALCMQVFQGATEAMRTHVQGGEYLFQDGRLWLQTLVRHPDGRLTWDRRPVALVMDLDETVLDNSGFEAWAIQTRQTYNPNGGAERFVSRALNVLAQDTSLDVTLIARQWEDAAGWKTLTVNPPFRNRIARESGFALFCAWSRRCRWRRRSPARRVR